MKDAVILFVLLLLAFPAGAGFAIFLRWLSQKKQTLRGRQAVADGSVMLPTFGIAFHLIMAAWRFFQHDGGGAETSLVVAAIFTSMFFGACAETRRFRKTH